MYMCRQPYIFAVNLFTCNTARTKLKFQDLRLKIQHQLGNLNILKLNL